LAPEDKLMFTMSGSHAAASGARRDAGTGVVLDNEQRIRE
jgi:hypothetical protein